MSLSGVYSNSSTVHNRGSSEFLPPSSDTCSRYQGLEGNLNANSPSSLTSPGSMREETRPTSLFMSTDVSPVSSSSDRTDVRLQSYHKNYSHQQQVFSQQQGCLYGEGKVVQPASDGGFEATGYFTNSSTSHSTGFDLLQDLQGQAGGGYSMSPCPDDNFLFQAGGVDRCLNQIYSIYLDSWWQPRTKKQNQNCFVFPRTKCSMYDVLYDSRQSHQQYTVYSRLTSAFFFLTYVINVPMGALTVQTN